MFNMNKKAISDIISNVLIILLSIASIIAVYSLVNNLLDSPALSPEYSCPVLQFKSPVKIYASCFNEKTNDIEITLKKSSEKLQISSMGFILTSDDGSETFSCGSRCSSCQIQNENLKTYFLRGNGNEKTASLKINSCIIETRKISRC